MLGEISIKIGILDKNVYSSTEWVSVSVSIDNRLDKRVNIEHDDREQFSLIFEFLTLFKIFEKAQLLKKRR